MLLQTDIWSLIAVLLAAMLAGIFGTWLFLHYRQKQTRPQEQKERDVLYLVFSRLGHRLKTATEVIRGHLQGLGEAPPRDDDRWKAARRAINDETAGISSLIERLDLVVRLGMTSQPLVMEPVNIPRLIEDLMLDMGPAADAKGIMLGAVVQAEQNDAHYISGDAMALREVFSNLLENALKHNPKGTELSVEVRREQDELLVRIKDTGKGMNPEILAGLFENARPNYRPRTTKGSGMGLYLCKLLIELHSGQITVNSTENKGTEFLVRLPLKRT